METGSKGRCWPGVQIFPEVRADGAMRLTSGAAPGHAVNRPYDGQVRGRSTAELERARRELRAQAGLVAPKPTALVPVLRLLDAVDAELESRAEGGTR